MPKPPQIPKVKDIPRRLRRLRPGSSKRLLDRALRPAASSRLGLQQLDTPRFVYDSDEARSVTQHRVERPRFPVSLSERPNAEPFAAAVKLDEQALP